jgi:hypothetical protein
MAQSTLDFSGFKIKERKQRPNGIIITSISTRVHTEKESSFIKPGLVVYLHVIYLNSNGLVNYFLFKTVFF